MATTPKTRRVYKGAATPTTITTSISNSADAVSISAATGWPTVGPFYAVIDPGLSTEEKIYVGAIAGTALTSITRGVDDTSGVGHDSGAVIYPVFTATDADEANQLTATYTTKGGIVYMGDPSFTQLAIGSTAGHALKVASTGVPEWGQLGSVGLAENSVTATQIAANAVDTSEIKDAAVTLAKLASAVQNLLVPVGTISAYAGATAPTGWLLCNGTSTSGYTSLAALVGATTPDLRGHVLVGKGSAPFDGALLTKFGSTTSTAPHTHDLGTHTHTTAHTHGGYSGDNDADHTHDYIRTGQTSSLVFNGADTAQDVVELALPGTKTSIQSRPHQHAVSTTSQSTTTSGGPTGGSGGSSAGATHGNVQPSALVNFIIKHD
jgi:microcystin-dependent protein